MSVGLRGVRLSKFPSKATKLVGEGDCGAGLVNGDGGARMQDAPGICRIVERMQQTCRQ